MGSSVPDYSRYTPEHFLFDEAFRRWVLNPDPEANAFWTGILRQHPHLSPVMEEARRLVPGLRVRTDELAEASRKRIWDQLDQRFDQLAEPLPLRRFGWWNPRFAAAAAVLALLITVGWWYLRPPARQEVRTGFGRTLTVRLPDGSEVKLNGNSALTYEADWSEGRPREVWLSGEGFFRVTKQQNPAGKIKFITHTPGMDITVLGTQFNVNTRRGTTAVTLIEGKIQLTDRRSRQTRVFELHPGQRAMRRTETAPLDVQTVRTEIHDAWTRDQFVFENTPLRDIADMLFDTYGLEITFPDDLPADKRFTANLSRQNVETLLTVIAETYQLDTERTGNRVVFRRRHLPD
ncbi:FecR family protein [Larkinella soli]|uniref:FecR family protein n=1 Tax=Larkinella soli TaxID=1770527 RepID=UPI000FFCB447|nr:FecR domain-containing protein [Larkinella soli]